MTRSYRWIIDRAKAGEPVSIDTIRRDMAKVIDYLMTIDGHGLTLQSEFPHDLLWVVRSDAV